MKSTKIPFSHFLEYWLVRFLETFIGCLPRGISLRLGAGLGACLYLTGVYHKVVKKNLDHVGITDKKRQREIMKSLYRNTGRLFADLLRPSDIPPPCVIDHFDIAKKAVEKGKGCIIVLAHFGNWEALASIFGTQLYDLNALAKPMKNKLIDKWLSEKRIKTRVTPIDASNVLRKMFLIIRRGGIIAILIDQYAGANGTPSLFLGKNANTVRTVAGMLQKTDCSIIFTYALLEKDGTYHIHIEEGVDLGLAKNDERYIAAYQQAHNDVLSRWIFSYPDHYFGWFHRRFKDSISY
jgi:KDO2-lipid IV(A) lauroyltransferase